MGGVVMLGLLGGGGGGTFFVDIPAGDLVCIEGVKVSRPKYPASAKIPVSDPDSDDGGDGVFR